MAARRSNKRKRRNRGRFGFLYKFMSLVIILVVVAAGCVVFFRVEEITVAGQSKYTADEIIAESGIGIGDNLFLIRRQQGGQGIVARLPYVDEVNIRRALPDGVIITVTECTPTAVIQGAGGWWLIDAKGKILEQMASPGQAGVARVTGLTALLPTTGTKLAVEDIQRSKLDHLLTLLQVLSERSMAGKVSSIDLSSPAHVLMVYDERFTVKFPMNAEDFSLKMRALDEAVSTLLQPNESGTIDLTRDDKAYFDPNTGKN